MLNLIRKFAAGIAFLGIVTAVGVAVAQQPQFGTRNPAPRLFPNQQTHYIRFTHSFNDCTLASGTCSVKKAAVPYNAFITRVYQQVITAFNSGTTDDFGICTASGCITTNSGAGGAASGLLATAGGCPGTAAGVLQAAPFNAAGSFAAQGFAAGGNGSGACVWGAHAGAAANGVVQLVQPSMSMGIQATGDGDTSTGSNGGFDIFVTYLSAGTAPTAGQQEIMIEYIAPNDGSCVQPPIGTAPPTPNAC